MAQEIERKFLVKYLPDWKEATTYAIRQGYLFDKFGCVARIRQSNQKYYVTIKSGKKAGTLGVDEREFSVPAFVGKFLLSISTLGFIDKTRYEIEYEGHTFELDVFGGHNDGLVIAEVELRSENEYVSLPPWVGEEVTGQSQYYNKNLARKGK